ncbi:MAG: helix-turn-helix domain-containing protein [Myxococcaceae bacterium]|nr:helix-turn-helix domain-containing protein [Myxococcaceae bacterium]
MTLREKERAELAEAFRTTEDRRLAERCQAVLMAARGRRPEEIAQDVCAGVRTVYTWLRLYREGGLAGLRITWAPGKTPLIPEAHAEEVKEWVRRGPQACGVARANWTYGTLAEHYARVKDVGISETCMRDFCHRHGIRPYRPTYRFLRGDPEKQARAAEEIEALKGGPARALSSA